MAGLTAESSMAALIEPYSSEKIDLPELGPVNVFKHELAVCRLPEQKSAQTLFARGAYDEIRGRIRKMCSVKILMKSILVNLLRREIALVNVFHYLLRSVNYLGSSCVCDGEVYEVLVVRARFVFETFEHVLKRFRQQVG